MKKALHKFLVVAVLIVPLAALCQTKATLQGIIKDPAGAAVSKATATVYSPDRIVKTVSGEDGRFRLADLPYGRYTLEVASPGFKTKVIEGLQVEEKTEQPLSIELEIAATGNCGLSSSVLYVKDNHRKTNLGGTVQYISGAPIAKVHLSISKKDGDVVLATQTADEKGEFQFESVEPGQYVLTASLEGYGNQRTQSFWIIRETLTRIQIMLVREGEIIICM